MNREIKIGERIELYEALNDGGFAESYIETGRIYPGTESGYPNLINIQGDICPVLMRVGPKGEEETRLVGAMTVKSLHPKCDECGVVITSKLKCWLDGTCMHCVPF